MVKNLPANAGDVSLIPGPGRSPIPVFLPGKSHGQRYSGYPMAGYSPWSQKVRHDLVTKTTTTTN